MHPVAAAFLDEPVNPRTATAPPLFRTTPPRSDIQNEKPIYRTMAYMFLKGATQAEVAETTGYSAQQISKIYNQRFFQDTIVQLSQMLGSEDVQSFIKGTGFEVAVQMKILATTAESESVRFRASQDLLDRVLGKAVNRNMNFQTSKDFSTPEEEVKALEDEIARLSSNKHLALTSQ